MPKATPTPAKAQADQAVPESYEEAVQELEQLLREKKQHLDNFKFGE